jgi:tRNA(adenine34) deaminase
MKKALAEAGKALAAGEFPVGCVLVHRNTVLATGTREGTTDPGINEVDHAEMMALRRLARIAPLVAPGEITLYVTMEPCLMCFSAAVITGIGRIVYAYEDVMGGGTRCDRSRLAPLYRNSTISVIPNVLRKESVVLFQKFFADNENRYWDQSLLATYTLGQR